MGVTGLWKLIESSGKPVPVETLENKVLCIDISIWLHQVVKGFQDNKGGSLANAHLLGLFHRLCKLMYYRIKPVFIFDGGVPQLKRETIAKRSQSRNKLQDEADRIQDLILQSLAREKIVQKALGPNVAEKLVSPTKPKQPSKPDKDEVFKLPSLKSSQEESNTSTSFQTDTTSDTDSSFDESNLRHSYQNNLQAIDVRSDHFKTLPADVRHEILTDIKETRKQSSWGRLHELPSVARDFSGFQMKRLLKRRQVQVSLEEAEKQMEGKSLTLAELETLMSEGGILKASESNAAKRIASDENKRFLLVKDLKKAFEIAQKIEKKDAKANESPAEKVEEEECAEEKSTTDTLGDEFDADLKKAIEMSLETTQVYSDKDYIYDAEVQLNEAQRQELKDATNSLARAYMIEYGGMNDDDISNLIREDGCEAKEDEELLQSSFNFKHNDRFVLKGEICTPYKDLPTIKEIAKEKAAPKNVTAVSEIQYISSSSDDSDFEEVNEITQAKTISKSSLEICFDPSNIKDDDDDLFSDIFQPVSEAPASSTTSVEVMSITTTDPAASSTTELSQDIISSPSEVTESRTETSDLDSTSIEFVGERKSKGAVKQVLTSSVQEKADDILQKLRNEMERVSTITLQQIGVKSSVRNDEEETDEIVVKEADVELKQNRPISGGTSNLEEILQNIQVQSKEAVSITLDDIQLGKPPTYVIDDSTDSDVEIISSIVKQDFTGHSVVKQESPSIELIQIPDEKPAIMKTPTKAGSQTAIDNFFETKFTVKRTPEKPPERETSPPPKIVSPFFVNKSQSGGKKRKSSTSSETTPTKNSKVAKQLFDKPMDESDADMKPLNENESKEESVSEKPADILAEAASILRTNKTREELENIADNIRSEKRDLELEMNRQSRMGTSISDKMAKECMQLLRLFGVPYVVAPMEAEAQCAFLDAIELSDGTITDDSDIWLFGGRTVYKNFFNQKKHVLEFKMENIEKSFNVDRKKLIQLAILVGSDYTTGVAGIGAVTALEILATFPITAVKEGETTETMPILSSLRKFREWWKASKSGNVGGRIGLRSKLKNVELHEAFPNVNIADAYLRPCVDDSRELFTWGEPDVESLKEFAKKTFGWTTSKSDSILQPVLKKMKERKTQASIKNYFAVKSVSSVHDLKVSKRVQKAIDRMSEDYVEPPPPDPKQRKKKTKAVSTSTTSTTKTSTGDMDEPKSRKRATKTKVGTEMPSSSATNTEEFEVPKKITKKLPRIPETKQIIPQREKDVEEMERRKQDAAKILKKVKGGK